MMTEPTRAELEAAVDQAGRLLRRECERFVERHRPYDLEVALRAYGAACQALGEHIGREGMRPVLEAADQMRDAAQSLVDEITDQEGGAG